MDYNALAQLLLGVGGPTLAAMGDDPRKQKGINPLNQTEGAWVRGGGGGAMAAVRGGGTPANKLERAAREVDGYRPEVGLSKAIDFASRRWEVDPKALLEFYSKAKP